jgi:hypothetical protein
MHARQSVAVPASLKLNPDEPLQLTGTLPMYPEEHNQDGTLKHSKYCMATPNRKDWGCHRCIELLLGAAPRKGWQRDYFARKLGQGYLRF